MGMPLEKHLETMAAFHQGVYPVSESRTLNLLQQAGFSKILRFYTGLWVGGWIATSSKLPSTFKVFCEQLSFMETKSERNDVWRTTSRGTMAAHLVAEAAHDVDAIMASHLMRRSFLMVKYSTLQSPFVMFILRFWWSGSFTRFVFSPTSSLR